MNLEGLALRAATVADGPFLLQLRADPGTADFLAVSDQDEPGMRAELAAAQDDDRAGRLIAIREHQPLAALKWTLVNRRSRIAELSEVIVAPAARGQGIGAETVRAACLLLIGQLHVHCVQLEVYGDNSPARRAFERAGFRQEGIRRQAYWRRGAWQDGVLYGVLAPELRDGSDRAAPGR
jgi:RimJ/RimL family protein N-acetyltransferase